MNASGLEQVLLPSIRDLGGFQVRRALPVAKRRMVGPFVFLDSFGPVLFEEGSGTDVRPHPHIGLATVTYLLEGELVHRDSETYVQTIRPGAVNLMTAGRGIVHSERSSPGFRAAAGTLKGVQTWLALPADLEETEPGFQHVGAGEIPVHEGEGKALRLLAGRWEALRGPTRIFSDTLYADVSIAAGERFAIPPEHIERAAYIVDGAVKVAGQEGAFGQDQLLVFKPGAEVILHAPEAVRLVLIGGEPLGPRYIYWNFVSSRQERILAACDDWREDRFPGVPGDAERIPLPASPPPRFAPLER